MKKLMVVGVGLMAMAAQADVALVKDGKPCAEIVHDFRASEPVKYAAQELQRWIGEITDAFVPVKTTDGDLKAKVRVYIGAEFAQKKFPKDIMTEVTLGTDKWNYALDVAAPLEFRECAWSDDCFTATNAVCEIFATGRRLPAWTLQDNQPAALQPSPVFTDAPAERLRFVPLGCQRLRLSVLPQATDDPSLGWKWNPTPATTNRGKRPACVTN